MAQLVAITVWYQTLGNPSSGAHSNVNLELIGIPSFSYLKFAWITQNVSTKPVFTSYYNHLNHAPFHQDIGDYSKRELLSQIKNLKKEKTELETTIKQFRCDGANEKRKQDKVIKDLMTQIRGFHNVPVKRQDSAGGCLVYEGVRVT